MVVFIKSFVVNVYIDLYVDFGERYIEAACNLEIFI